MSEDLQYSIRRFLSFWKSAVWSMFMGVIFLLPSDNLSKAPSIPLLAEAAHFILFSVFTWFLFLDLLRYHNRRLTFKKYSFSIFFAGLIFGMLIEILQEISGLGRTAEIMDILADLCGIMFAILVLWLLFRRKQNTVSKD